MYFLQLWQMRQRLLWRLFLAMPWGLWDLTSQPGWNLYPLQGKHGVPATGQEKEFRLWRLSDYWIDKSNSEINGANKTLYKRSFAASWSCEKEGGWNRPKRPGNFPIKKTLHYLHFRSSSLISSGGIFILSMCSRKTLAHFCSDSITVQGSDISATKMTRVSGKDSAETANFSRPLWYRSPSRIHTLQRVWSKKEAKWSYWWWLSAQLKRRVTAGIHLKMTATEFHTEHKKILTRKHNNSSSRCPVNCPNHKISLTTIIYCAHI